MSSPGVQRLKNNIISLIPFGRRLSGLRLNHTHPSEVNLLVKRNMFSMSIQYIETCFHLSVSMTKYKFE